MIRDDGLGLKGCFYSHIEMRIILKLESYFHYLNVERFISQEDILAEIQMSPYGKRQISSVLYT